VPSILRFAGTVPFSTVLLINWMTDSLFTWGFGKFGQLGHGDETNTYAPREIDRVMLQGQTIASVHAGFLFNTLVTKKGDVYSWGYGKTNQHGQENKIQLVPRKIKSLQRSPVKTVSNGCEHVLCLLESGAVVSWGNGDFGKLGHGNELSIHEPKNVKFNPRGSICLDEDEETNIFFIVSIACGHQHSLAVDDTGNVFSWGLGEEGRLGHGDETIRLAPKKIRVFSEQHLKVASIKCGWAHSLALTEQRGMVYTWGSNRSCQLGGIAVSSTETGYLTRPTKLIQWKERSAKGLRNAKTPRVMAISCGGKHNLALSDEKEVFSWGRGELGRLGHDDENSLVYPTKIPGLECIASVSAGGYHSLALCEKGGLYVWGSAEHGRLGIGESNATDMFKKPTLIHSTNPNGNQRLHITSIEAGDYVSMALGTIDNRNSKNQNCNIQ